MPDNTHGWEQTAQQYRYDLDVMREARDNLFQELSDLKLRHAEVIAEGCGFCDERIKTVDRLDAQVMVLSDALCLTLEDNLRIRQLGRRGGHG